MKITRAESFILKAPIGGVIADSMQSVSDIEFVGIRIDTDEGLSGTGYTVTVGHGGSVIQTVLDTLYIPELAGLNPCHVKEIWHKLYFGKAHWIGRAGATTMAQSAVDIELWDIMAIAHRLRNRKALDLLIENATITEGEWSEPKEAESAPTSE
jgi:L-alanine-DL-glutamate epimerase-like enolase superfamily enzyme